MKLEEVLQSRQIEIHNAEEFKRKSSLEKRNIINPERHKDIVNLAHEVGIFSLFRKQLPNQSSHSLWFFKELYDFTKDHKDLELYTHHVENFQWKDDDKKYSSYLNHWIFLCKELKNKKYLEIIRNEIDNSFSFIPKPEDILKQIQKDRYSNITNSILFKPNKGKIEKARRTAFREPTNKEVEKVINRLTSLKLSRSFSSASKLYSISENVEDLARAVDYYNKFLECENKTEYPNFFFNAREGLKILLKTSKRNAIREEYKNKSLEQVKEDWMVGTAFSNIKDLFLITRLPYDKRTLDELIEKGINLLENGISTNFSNYTEELFELFEATKNKDYLEKYESIHSIKNKNNHLVALSIFEATGDHKYLPDIEDYCQTTVKKSEYKIAEHIYFKMFEVTKDKKYFNKAKEMTEIMKEAVSEEKYIITPEIIYKSLNKVLSAQNKTQEMLTGENQEYFSVMPSLKEMNQLEVSIRISENINILLKYTTKFPDDKDIKDLRMNISLLEEITTFNSDITLDYLFDLYQITGNYQDLDKIKSKFESYILEEPDIMKSEMLLKKMAYKGDF